MAPMSEFGSPIVPLVESTPMRRPRRLLSRQPSRVSVRPLDPESRGDRVFLRYVTRSLGVPWLVDEEDVDLTMIYVESQRVGILGIEWDYTNDTYVEGRIWLQHVVPRFRRSDPWRFAIADVKESCRFQTRMVSVIHRLTVLVDPDSIDWLRKMYDAGFREISRDHEAILMVWPNDDCE